MTNRLRRYAAALSVASLALVGCSSTDDATETTSEQETVTLRMATSFNQSNANNDGFWIFVENLQQNAPWIELEYKGGPEVMAPDVLIEGVASGIFDMVSMPGDYYVNQMPAMEVPRYTPYTPMEEREKGITEIYDTMHREQLGVKYLGHTAAGMPQIIMTNTPFTEADLQRQSIRTSSATSSVVQAINGVPVDLPLGETYTSLERGVVDGASSSATGVSSLGLEQVVDYYMAPRFYDSIANLTMNERTWDSLDERTQQAITDTMAESEPEIFEHYLRMSVTETELWEEAGVEETQLTDAAAQEMLEAAYYDSWEQLDWDSIIDTTPAAAELKVAYEEGLTGDLADVVPAGSNIEKTKEILAELEGQQ